MCSIRDVCFWKDFFSLYRHYPELWKVKSEAYKNRILKRKAYGHLLEKFREYEPDATEDTLKKKINNIRGCYRREVKKVNKSYESGCAAEDVYKPNLWYYNDLVFLKDQEEEPEDGITSLEIETNFLDSETQENSDYQEDPVGVSDIKIKTAPTKHVRPSFLVHKYEHKRERSREHSRENYEHSREQYKHSLEPYEYHREKYEHPREKYEHPRERYERPREKYEHPREKYENQREKYEHPKSKRLATEKALQDLKLICKELNQPPEEQNEFDCFGSSVACQLKKLPEKLAQQSMDHIQSYLVQQRLNGIENPNLVLTLNTKRMRSENSVDDQDTTQHDDISQMSKRKKEIELAFMELEHKEKLKILNLEKRNLENRLKYDEEEHIIKIQQLSTIQNQSI